MELTVLGDEDDDFPPGGGDPAMEAWYGRMSARSRPEGMTLEVKHGQEGPEHDPYAWTEYRVSHPGRGSAVYRSGILSERLELTFRKEHTLSGQTLRFAEPEYQGPPDIRWIFEDWLGETVEQLDFWANEDWEAGDEVREAELAAGWDPSP